MMINLNQNGARSVFRRYIITNLLILLPPFIVAVVYFAMASSALSRAADAAAEVQLEGNVAYVDRKFADLDKMVSQLVVDYRVNRYLNAGDEIDPIEIYDKKLVSDRLAAIILGCEFLDRCMLYLGAGDRIIYESGFADFPSFYGSLFQVEGWDADSWRSFLRGGKSGTTSVYPGFMVSSGSSYVRSHFLIRPIGYSDHFRGAFMAIIDAAALGRRLSRLPDLYGGGIFVFDREGNLLASSPTDSGSDLIRIASSGESLQKISIGNERYRQYRQISTYNGWRYVALVNEAGITGSANRIRSIAFILLGAGFLLAFALSFGLASSNSKPIIRLFSLISNFPDNSPARASGVYERVEEAILNLSDSNSRLEKEVNSALSIARNYFFHNLLRGEYRDRVLFAEDRKRFSVPLSVGPYYVIEGRLPSLVAALGEAERHVLSDAFFSALTAGLAADEHGVSLSSGAMVMIKHASSAGCYRSEAARFIEGILGGLDPSIGDDVIFGIGTPVEDVFLISLSFGEADAALSSGNFYLRTPVQFYESLPAPANSYHYPLAVESAVMKAVLSANQALLESLIEGVFAENFSLRTLTSADASFLVAAFRGTAMRLMGELGESSSMTSECLSAVGANDAVPQDDFREVAKVLSAMAEEKKKGKRSHNAALSGGIREYVSAHFRDFGLSLTRIAETFNLSENYLSSFFKEQEGECLYEYIQRRRMTEASKQLKDSREAVDAIAANCGYSNGTSFRRAFKRIYGISPSEYRNRNDKTVIRSKNESQQ